VNEASEVRATAPLSRRAGVRAGGGDRGAGFSNVTVLGKSGDGGIDGVGVYRLSLVSFPVYFQCKRYKGTVTAGTVRDFRGAMAGRGEKGLLITTATNAQRFVLAGPPNYPWFQSREQNCIVEAMDNNPQPGQKESSPTVARHVTIGFMARRAGGITGFVVWALALMATSISLRHWLLATTTMSAAAAWFWGTVLVAGAAASVAGAPGRRRRVVAAALAVVSVLAFAVVGGSVPVQYSWPVLPKPSPVLSAALAILQREPESFVVSGQRPSSASRVLQRGTIDWTAKDLTMSTWVSGQGYLTLVIKNGVTLSDPKGDWGVGKTWAEATTANPSFINPDQAVRFQGAWARTSHGKTTVWSVRVVPDKTNTRVWLMRAHGLPLRDEWGAMYANLRFGWPAIGPLVRVAVTLSQQGSIATVTYYSSDDGTKTTSFSPLH